jgi:oligosaccharide reducing-end xylanase
MKRCFTFSTLLMLVLSSSLASCNPAKNVPSDRKADKPPMPTHASLTATSALVGAFTSGQYRNLFEEMLSKSDAEIQAKLDAAWEQLFYGNDDTQRVYYPVGTDMAYVMDIGNGDVRTEGMSYGMMIAVQMDKQEEFDRLWKWAKTYMYQEDGPYQGYFAWHCTPEGEQIDANPASDGEEWFVMALLFAAGRWGNGEGITNYEAEAQAILHTMLHKADESDDIATNMFHPEYKQVVFVPRLGRASQFTDPSYHLPHYYELWARWADEDNEFWAEAATASREFFKKAAHPETGLMPDYAEFDGTPTDPWGGGHDAFRFDAWRNGMNIAVDYAWFAADEWEVEQSNRLLDFFYDQGIGSYANQFTLDGESLSGDHSLGLVAMNATAGLAATTDKTPGFVRELWDASPPTGRWRYYDGMLYMLALLHVSGNFRIYSPSGQ